MELKKVSDLPNANDVKSDDLIMLIQKNAGESTSTKITVEKLNEYFSAKNPLIKTIDLTKVNRYLSIWNYMERDEIQTFSDMMLDYLNYMGVTEYKADKFYAEYIPDLIENKIEENDWDKDWLDIVIVRGFAYEKIRTAHIKDKETNGVVAKVNYIGDDDDEDMLNMYIEHIITQTVPIESTNIDYYIKMVNYGLKNGITLINEDGEEYQSVEPIKPEKFINLIGYPFDNKRLQLNPMIALTEEEEEEEDFRSPVLFYVSIDYPTGCLPLLQISSYGTQEWVIKPDQIR